MAPSSPKRPSKFIEALALDDKAIATSPSPTNDLFYSILHEMDEFESRQQQKQLRERGGSQSSFDSLPSSNGSPRTPTQSMPDRSHTVKEGRRSINFTRSSMDKELASRPRSGSPSGSDGENAGDRLARKFVGRLRALTGSRRDGELKAVAYPGS